MPAAGCEGTVQRMGGSLSIAACAARSGNNVTAQVELDWDFGPPVGEFPDPRPTKTLGSHAVRPRLQKRRALSKSSS
jgi:hypothetical protein